MSEDLFHFKSETEIEYHEKYWLLYLTKGKDSYSVFWNVSLTSIALLLQTFFEVCVNLELHTNIADSASVLNGGTFPTHLASHKIERRAFASLNS